MSAEKSFLHVKIIKTSVMRSISRAFHLAYGPRCDLGLGGKVLYVCLKELHSTNKAFVRDLFACLPDAGYHNLQ